MVIGHNFREANWCANALAAMACGQVSELVIYDIVPSQLELLLLTDLSGVSTPRSVLV